MSPAVTLVAGRVATSPARPRADERLIVSVPVRRSDTGRPLAAGTVSCDVRADGTRLRAAGGLRPGTAQCSFDVPAGTRRVQGRIVVRSGALSVVAPFSYDLR